MKKIIFLAYLITIFCVYSCNNSSKYVTVLMENGSQVKPNIEIVTYLNDAFYGKYEVQGNKEKVSYKEFKINIVDKMSKLNLKFFITGYHDTTSCFVIEDSISKVATVHVNFKEVLFKKGDSYKGYILDKDTIVKKELYSEVIYQ